MTPSINNHIKLWWHCLIKRHRAIVYGNYLSPLYGIKCNDCNYGGNSK